jgi:lincosamide nucleotidyltransferase A/C/D/E
MQIRSRMSSEDVVEFVRLMEENGIDVHLDGGWGVDALLGLQTRSHEDLDIAVQHKDVPALRGLLEARGYRESLSPDAKDCNFVLSDSQGRKIDVHSYTFDPQGSHVYGIAYPIASLTGTGMIHGHPVKCISAEWAVKFHTQYEPDETDFQDVQALCARFDISLPEVYRKVLR